MRVARVVVKVFSYEAGAFSVEGEDLFRGVGSVDSKAAT